GDGRAGRVARAGRGGGDAGDVDVVLHRRDQPGQRKRRAGGDGGVDRGRLGEHIGLGPQRDPDLRAVDPVDGGVGGVHPLDRRRGGHRPLPGPTTTSGSPPSTVWPVVTRILRTTPSAGARNTVSIFIASSASSGCPALTGWPSVTSMRHTLEVNGAS